MEKESIYRTLSGTVGDIAFTGVFDNNLFDNKGSGYNPNMHGWYEINIVYSGECYLEGLNGHEEGPLTVGDIALISPGYYHEVKKTGEVPAGMYKVRFEIANAFAPVNAEKLYAILLTELQTLGHGIFRFRLKNGIKYFEEITQYLAGGETGSIANAEATFKMFMTEFFMEIMHLKSRKDGDGEVIADRKVIIETFLENNYSNSRLTADNLAKHLNLSVRQMNRIVTSLYGVTFYQLLTGIRLEYAKKMLLARKTTIKEVAAMVGYDSSTGFFVAFKKKFGMTPGEFCQAERK